MASDCPTGKYSFGVQGKGSRPRSYGVRYCDGYDAIDWSKKSDDCLIQTEDPQSSLASEPLLHSPQPTDDTGDTKPQKAPSY